LLECRSYCGDKLQQTQPRIDVAGTLAGLLGQRGNVVARKVKQALKALGLFVGEYVFTLRVLDKLALKRLGMRELLDASRKKRKHRIDDEGRPGKGKKRERVDTAEYAVSDLVNKVKKKVKR